jgi:uncharacterized protein YecE (DUF72 family)
MVEGWAERTPPNFTMHVKAFAPMTRHPVKLEQLPPDLRGDVEVDSRGRVERPSREVRGELFRRFLEALEPLRVEGKLGGILFQLPSYVVPKPASYEYLEWAREKLGDHEMLVEFRHRDWFAEDTRAETLSFLERLPASHVRFHGRNLGTWNKRGGSAADRFDHLYSDEELGEWVEPLRELGGEAEQAFAFFNNNSSSPSPRGDGGRVAQAATNATQLKRLLDAARIPATGGAT